jgi:hypothetical protein
MCGGDPPGKASFLRKKWKIKKREAAGVRFDAPKRYI